MEEYPNPFKEEKPESTPDQGAFKDRFGRYEQHRARKRFGFGLIILVIGVFILLKQFGLHLFFPIREFWPYVLILIGIAIGLKNNFRSPAPFILIIIGLAHAIPAFSFELGDTMVYSRKLVAPLVLISAGLYFLLVSKKKSGCLPGQTPFNNNNFVSKDVFFGGAKEIITSKEFSGGDVSAIFGGAELNLTQADTTTAIVHMNVRAVFGGVEIIVPSHWDIKNEMFVALGSVDDQRVIRVQDPNVQRKTLVLKGLCMFGGVEIKSF
ncbi:MAG TPA: LiaF domain-containing protein [Flavipsychrobacter sp.]|nr:LiaF domain-containing protein [Flavipsychrobacter sp.]